VLGLIWLSRLVREGLLGSCSPVAYSRTITRWPQSCNRLGPPSKDVQVGVAARAVARYFPRIRMIRECRAFGIGHQRYDSTRLAGHTQ
jgi:hypothetical protein